VEINKYVLLARLATRFIGITEQGGDNKGQIVEWFQKQSGGPAAGEAWCCAFARSLIDWVDTMLAEEAPSSLIRTEGVLPLWRSAPDVAKSQSWQTGWLACWEHSPNGVASGKGHIGICIGGQPGTPTFTTVEGNTGPGAGVEREGDGIYRKDRTIGRIGDMVLLGFINPWWRSTPS
jgi:hypothetical protein